MKFASSTYNVGYPVYGSKFLNDTMLLVAGGGGEGNNGIPNKLTVLRVDFEKKKVIKRFREITLDPNDDSPTTLDAANNLILMGCNENSEKIKSGGGNQSLRKFVYENDHLKFVASIDFDGSVSPEDYIKLTYMSRDGSVGAIASSKVPTVIRIIDPRSLEEKYEIETGHDVKDMHFAPDGKVIGYITASTLEIISIVTGRFIIRKNDFDKNYILSKVRFLTDDVVLIAASLQKGTGVVLIKISLKSGSATLLKTKMVTNKFKGLTSMDVDPENQLAVLAGNDNSMALVKLKDFSLGRMFKQVHSFAITRVAFSPDSKLIASVSAANTINVIKVPEKFAQSTSLVSKIWKLIVNFVLIVIIAFLGQLSYKYNLHERCYTFLKQQYLARRKGPDAGIDILKQTTLVGDIVSEITTTRPFDTAGDSGKTSAFNTHKSQFTYKTSSFHDNSWLSDSLGTSSTRSDPEVTSTKNEEMKVSSTSSLPMSVSSHHRKQTSSLSSRVLENVPQFSSRTQGTENHIASKIVTEGVSYYKYQHAPDEEVTTETSTVVSLKSGTSEKQPAKGRNSSLATGSTEVISGSASQSSASTSGHQDMVEGLSESFEGSEEPIQTSALATEAVNEVTPLASDAGSPQNTDTEDTPELSIVQKEEIIEVSKVQPVSEASGMEKEFATRTSASTVISEPASKDSISQTQFQENKFQTGVPSKAKMSLSSSHLPVETEEDEDFIKHALNPSGAELDFDSLEEMTHEPSGDSSAERETTTPTEMLVSATDSTESNVEIPFVEVSLETGKGSSRPVQDAVDDGPAPSTDKSEIKVHVEIPTEASSGSVEPTSIESKPQTLDGRDQSLISGKDVVETRISSHTVLANGPSTESLSESTIGGASSESDDEPAKKSKPAVSDSGAQKEAIDTRVASVKSKPEVSQASVTSETNSVSTTTVPKLTEGEKSTSVETSSVGTESIESTEPQVTNGGQVNEASELSSVPGSEAAAKSEPSSAAATLPSRSIESVETTEIVPLDEEEVSLSTSSDAPEASSPSQSAVVYDEL